MIDRYDRFDRGHVEVASVAAEDCQTIGLGHHAVGSGSSRGLSALSVRGCWRYIDNGADLGVIVDHRFVGLDAEHQPDVAHQSKKLSFVSFRRERNFGHIYQLGRRSHGEDVVRETTNPARN